MVYLLDGMHLCDLPIRVWAADPTRPCPCLGKAPELVGASQFQMDLLAKLLLGYLFGGGALLLILGSNPPKSLLQPSKHE